MTPQQSALLNEVFDGLDYHGEPVRLGNVTVWKDGTGPWANQWSYDIPVEQWDKAAVCSALIALQVQRDIKALLAQVPA